MEMCVAATVVRSGGEFMFDAEDEAEDIESTDHFGEDKEVTSEEDTVGPLDVSTCLCAFTAVVIFVLYTGARCNCNNDWFANNTADSEHGHL